MTSWCQKAAPSAASCRTAATREICQKMTIAPEMDLDPCRDPAAIKKLPGIIVGIMLKHNLGSRSAIA